MFVRLSGSCVQGGRGAWALPAHAREGATCPFRIGLVGTSDMWSWHDGGTVVGARAVPWTGAVAVMRERQRSADLPRVARGAGRSHAPATEIFVQPYNGFRPLFVHSIVECSVTNGFPAGVHSRIVNTRVDLWRLMD